MSTNQYQLRQALDTSPDRVVMQLDPVTIVHGRSHVEGYLGCAAAAGAMRTTQNQRGIDGTDEINGINGAWTCNSRWLRTITCMTTYY